MKVFKESQLAGDDTAVGIHLGTDDRINIVQVSTVDVAINLDIHNGVGRGDRIELDFGRQRVGDVNVATSTATSTTTSSRHRLGRRPLLRRRPQRHEHPRRAGLTRTEVKLVTPRQDTVYSLHASHSGSMATQVPL